jgi:hypothetical protein
MRWHTELGHLIVNGHISRKSVQRKGKCSGHGEVTLNSHGKRENEEMTSINLWINSDYSVKNPEQFK